MPGSTEKPCLDLPFWARLSQTTASIPVSTVCIQLLLQLVLS
jgi:hypothetical protein